MDLKIGIGDVVVRIGGKTLWSVLRKHGAFYELMEMGYMGYSRVFSEEFIEDNFVVVRRPREAEDG